MQCCVPFCDNTSDDLSSSKRGITFHGLPRDINLRAVWLRALGAQDSRLPRHSVICSQHFIHDDFNATNNCKRQIRSGAIPSTMPVCMMCLDTVSKLCVMSRHKLEEAYEQLTGLSLFQLCRRGHLKQTLCVLCAQRLINFSRFRDLGLRAHSLMMDLVEQHEFITSQHKVMMNYATKQLKPNLTQTTLATNHCDLYIHHTDEEELTAAEESTGDVAAAVVKNEDDALLVTDYLELVHEDDQHIDNPNECTSNDRCSDGRKKTINNTHGKASATVAEHHPVRTSVTFGCTICSEEFAQEDAYNTHMITHLQNAGGDAACGAAASCSWDSLVPDNKSGERLNDDLAASADSAQGSVAPVCASAANKDDKAQATDTAATFSCDLCHYKCAYKSMFLQHVRVHTGEKPYSCDECNYRCARKSHLIYHKRIHTGEKPYSCDTCDYKCADQSCLLRHLRTHTGEKPYSCQMCNYKCTQKGSLLAHLRTHSGKPSHFKRPKETDEKLYCCKMCSYKSAIRGHFVKHVRVHTGEKPYACEMCSYRCADRSCLVRHVRTHTGVKPYSCELCSYKCAQKGSLLAHKRTHSDERPFAWSSSLLKHMMVHSDGKPQE